MYDTSFETLYHHHRRYSGRCDFFFCSGQLFTKQSETANDRSPSFEEVPAEPEVVAIVADRKLGSVATVSRLAVGISVATVGRLTAGRRDATEGSLISATSLVATVGRLTTKKVSVATVGRLTAGRRDATGGRLIRWLLPWVDLRPRFVEMIMPLQYRPPRKAG